MTLPDECSTVDDLLRAHLGRDHAIVPAARLREDLGLDSLGILELAAALESRWRVTIPHDVLNRLTTVSDLHRAVCGAGTPPG